MEKKIIPFHWNAFNVIATILVALTVGAVSIRLFTRTPQDPAVLPILTVWGVLLTFLFFSPRKLEVTEDALILHKIIGKKRIPYASILEARPVQREELKNTLRTFGSAGWLGYLGHFRSSGFGNYFAYATEWKSFIWIRTPNRKYLIGCREAHYVCEYIRRSKLKENA